MEAVSRITWNLYKADNIRSVILLALLEVITITDVLEERLEKVPQLMVLEYAGSRPGMEKIKNENKFISSLSVILSKC